MKYSTNSSDNVLFYEQVKQMTNIYEQWNDCERTVVIYALFKRLPFANLKFLLHAIDHHLKQSVSTPQHWTLLEEAANATSFLNKLFQKYNTLVNFTSSSDNIDAGSDQEFCGSESIKSLENDLVSKYTSKEEIIQDVLMYLPLLRPNNEEGKKIYIQFVPVLIEDAIKHNIPIELVQQILSYLLIHPAIKADDRKSLHQWLQKLQEHMNLSFAASSISSNSSAYNSLLPSDNVSSFMSTTPSMSSASSSSSASSTTWPTAVPQIQTGSDVFKTKREQEFWDLRNFPVSQDFCDDLNQTKYPLPIGNNSASQNKQKNLSVGGGSKPSSIFDTNDEHHISFSKNGTEVDFESDFIDGLSNSTASLTINAPSGTSSDFLTVPNFFHDRLYDIYGYGALSDGFSDDGSAVKTRRSNSLTTPTASGDFTSSSAENLANLQKPRSFSLSMESSRNALMSCGSETRLDDYNKLAQLRMNSSNQVGMSNIAVWLKSLRLHKYLWLFTNMTYEQMMEITEEHLENLGVTKGARHKLVLCIQKLAERVPFLKQLEKEMMDGSRSLKSGMDELANVVLTPMKPINSVPCEEDVAAQVMRIMDCAFQIMQSIKYVANIDEDSVNAFMWTIDKALHHDAFLQQMARLKEYKFKLQRIKIMFSNKMYGNGNNNGKGNNMKMRWNNNKGKGSNQSVGPDNNQKPRKNSMPYYSNVQSYHGNQNTGNNGKSGSFSSFSNTQASNLSNFQRSTSREKLNQFTLMQQQHHLQFNQQVSANSNNSAPYHRNSLNNLTPFSMQTQQQFGNRRNSSCGTERQQMMSNGSMHSPLGSLSNNEKNLSDQNVSSTSPNFNANNMNTMIAPTTNDINSRLESLCRQMTEQAIN